LICVTGTASAQEAAKDNWYFSWGYSRQHYAPTDIHISQPSLGNDFTVRRVEASDFPSTLEKNLQAIARLDITNPQENVRIGYYLNPEKILQWSFQLTIASTTPI